MSGSIVQLVATGAQDAWLTGKPEVSFFRSNYRRYTHFANSVERQIIQGTPSAGGMSTVRFEKKGDLLSYIYFTAVDAYGAQCPIVDWSKVFDKIELMIGGQVIDTQDFTYSAAIEPVTGAQTHNQRLLRNNTGTYAYPNNGTAPFYPLKFFFCKDWSVSLPLVALQFHDVELRITWSDLSGSVGGTNYTNLQYQCWSNFVNLDQAERDYFAKSSHDLLITQVQRTLVQGGAGVTMQELALAQPVKFIAFSSVDYGTAYNGGASNQQTAAKYQIKTQINGVDIGEFRHVPHWTDIPQYYNTTFGYLPNGVASERANVAIISYCLDTAKLQPTGTLNFSRLDTYRIVVPTSTSISAIATGSYFYAVSYNVLRIQNGLGSLLYAN